MDEPAADELNVNDPEAVKAAVAALTEQGMPEKEAMRQIARQTGLSRRDIYRMCIE